MNPFSHRLLFTGLLAALMLPACLQTQRASSASSGRAEEDEDMPKMPPPLHLGAVHQVYPEKGFCLLRMLGPIPVPGTTLITHPADGSNDRIGNLCVSKAQSTRGGIIAADIRSGVVVKGDRVFRYRDIAPTEGEETEEQTPDDADAGLTDAEKTVAQTPIGGEEEEDDVISDTPAPTETPVETPTVDTTIVPEGTPKVDTTPAVNGLPKAEVGPKAEVPISTEDGNPAPSGASHLDDIPDNIDDWN